MNRLQINTEPSVTSTADSDVGILTPSTTFTGNNNINDLYKETPVANPKTLAGQRIGALLAVKRTPTLGGYDSSPEVGDLLVVTKHYNHYCDVMNIRTQNRQTVSWEIFFPLTIGEKCCCPGGDCRCEVEDPEGFYAYRLALAGLGSFPVGVSPKKLSEQKASKKA